MTFKYDTVLFDLDGTLLDTLDDIADAVNYAMQEMGYERRSMDDIRKLVGGGVAQMLQNASYDAMDADRLVECLHIFRAYYTANMQNKSVPYEGIMQLLEELNHQNFTVGVVSNKTDENVKQLCLHYFEGLYQIALGDSDAIKRKPEPDGIFFAIDQLGSDPAKTVYVGDSENDVLAANNAHVRLAAVTWGFRDREALLTIGAKESDIIDSPDELWDILNGTI